MNSPSQHIDEQEAKWFAVRTSFRKEKYFVQQLLMQSIEAYVPIQEVRRVYKSRTKNVSLPLIPNYAFVRIKKADYIKVLQATGFLAFVHFSGEIIPIPEKEMEVLKLVVAEEEELRCSTETLATGDWVEIKAGQLVGMKGQLVEEKSRSTYQVQLERLGLYLTIDVKSHLLRKIKAA